MAAFLTGWCSPVQSATLGVLGVIGAALPDIDSRNARPRQILLGVLGVGIPVLLAGNVLSRDFTNEALFCWMIAAYAAIRYGADFILSRCSRHRGAFHSIPAALMGRGSDLPRIPGFPPPGSVRFRACGNGRLSVPPAARRALFVELHRRLREKKRRQRLHLENRIRRRNPGALSRRRHPRRALVSASPEMLFRAFAEIPDTVQRNEVAVMQRLRPAVADRASTRRSSPSNSRLA